MGEVVIRVENLKKKYRLGGIDSSTFWGDVRSRLARNGQSHDFYKRNQEFWALRGFSFDVEKGETLGVIGANGAGKSTFLKILSRVTEPTEGTIKVKGRISSMLEVGTGFHGELTGRENCYLNGAICGMSKGEIAERMEDIIAFSEIGAFIDTPVKRYSSGMYVKLAFSVAAHLNAEIMIMDEVLAVGDLAFQNKCLDKMRSLAREEGRTVLYVSHNMTTIRSLCSKCIVLKQGQLLFHGDTDEAVRLYAGLDQHRVKGAVAERPAQGSLEGKTAVLLKLELLNSGGGRISCGDSLHMKVWYRILEPVKGIRIRCTFSDKFGNNVATGFSAAFEPEAEWAVPGMDVQGTETEAAVPGMEGQATEQEMEIHSGLLAPGEYDCSIALFVTDVRGGYMELDAMEKVFPLTVVEKPYGQVDCRWDALHHGQVRLPDTDIW